MVVENPKYFYSPGKLLLTGEYVVLDGAKSLAIPTIFGQSLNITSIPALAVTKAIPAPIKPAPSIPIFFTSYF